MAVTVKELPDTLQPQPYEVVIIDKELNLTVTFEPGDITYLEWDGYPEANWTEAEFFLVELEGDVASYFPDAEGMDDRTREVLLNLCESIYNGSSAQTLDTDS